MYKTPYIFFLLYYYYCNIYICKNEFLSILTLLDIYIYSFLEHKSFFIFFYEHFLLIDLYLNHVECLIKDWI